MIHYGFQNANSSVITVTNTATLLSALINTAGSVTHVFPSGLNGFDIFIEDGDVRILFDGNTPTASKGLLLKQGTVHHFRGVDFHQAKLIRTGSSNVLVDVQIGFVENNEEVTTSSGGAGGTGTGAGQVQGTAADNAAGVGNPVIVGAEYNTSAPTYDNGDATTNQADVNGNLKTREQYAPAYEDNTNGVAKVEQRFSYNAVIAADAQIKAGAGFLHTITFSCNDAAPTAGSIIVYDSLTETGTQIFNHTFTTTPFVPFTLTFDVSFATGLYVGFTTTADVNVSVSFR
jgi:hypothetical protein